MKNKSTFLTLIFCCFSLLAFAQLKPKTLDLTHLQNLQKKAMKRGDAQAPPIALSNEASVDVNLSMGQNNFQINYIDITNPGQLRKLADQLEVGNYPLTILHKDVFSAFSELLLEYDALAYQYEGLERTCDTLSALREREIESLKSIIQLEKDKSAIMESSRDQMKQQVTHLNEQLNVSIEIKKKSARRNFGKNFLMAIVGGAVGFATGIIVLEFAR